MKNISRLLACLGVTIACFAGVSQAAHAAVAGHVQFINGDVQITNLAGQARPAKKGDAISEGDTLTSAPSASAQIKMQDGGFVAVRSDTKLKFDKFIFAGKQDGSEKSFFSLFKGGFRAVTGFIGQINKENYRINTPAATIGIRGTDHETFLIAPGSPLAQIAPTGAYNKVNVGETSLTTEKGTISVLPNQMGFAGGMNQVPQIQPINTKIFTVAEAPAPQAKADKKEEKKEEKAGSKREQKTAKSDKEEKKEEKKEGGKDSKQADKGNGEAKGDAKAKQEGTATTAGGSQDAAGSTSTANGDSTAGGATQGTAAAPQEAAPIRTTAVVDAVAPSASLIQSPVAPATAAPAIVDMPIAPLPVYVPPPIITTTTGTVFNPVVLTATTAGQVTTVTTAPVVTAVATAVPVDNRIAWELAGWWWVGGLSAAADVAPLANPPTFTYRYSAITGEFITITMNGATGAVNGTAAGGINFGSWSNVTNAAFSNSYPFGGGSNLGMSGSSWIYGPMGYRDPSTPIAGSFTYALDGWTAPTNFNTGIAGTLNSATLTANFTTNLISVALGLTHSGTVWGATATNIPVSTLGNGNFSSGLTITQGGAACGACWGNIQGGFTGQNFSGAIAQYDLWDGAGNGNISGAAAFVRGAGAVTNTTTVPNLGFAVYDRFGWWGNATTITSTANVLAGYSNTYNTFVVTCAAGACTGAPATNAATGALTGIYLGTWSKGTVTWTGSGTTGPQQWITGPVAGPAYLPEVLLGTAAYTYSAGGGPAPTGIIGSIPSTGTLNSASLAVNFTQQTVAIALSATVAGNTYVVSTPAGGVAMLSSQSGNNSVNSAFWFNVGNCPGCSNAVNLAINGTQALNAFGQISGQLTGQGLTGAILSYQLYPSNQGGDSIQGVAALALSPGTPIDTATSYRIAAAVTPANLYQGNNNGIVGGYNNSTRAVFDGAANLTTLDVNTYRPERLSITGATAVERGSDPVSGISWGRWSGGTQNSVDRMTGATFSQATPASGVHWIAGPNMTTAVDLPISGTFNYVFAGGTTPTDQAGTTGILQSATLSANFTAMTVNTGVTVAMPTATITASTTGLPITNGFFGGDSKMIAQQVGATASVTCTGTGCGAAGTHGAKIDGVFTGTGGVGAGVLYGLQTGAMTVGGVAAFHR